MGIFSILRSVLHKIKALFYINANNKTDTDNSAKDDATASSVLSPSHDTKIKDTNCITREESFSADRLSNQGCSYYITQKTVFRRDGKLKKQTVELVLDFAYKMAFTDEGAHRRNRSGGSRKRRNGEIFANVFQGKIAECAACNYLFQVDRTIYPDFSTHPLGEWDTVDLTVAGNEIAIKSTKHYGQLLLLETKDWDHLGNYIPNMDSGFSSYDYIMLIRLKPSCEDILRRQKLLYSDHIERQLLLNLLTEQTWEYNFVGYITRTDLQQIIRTGYVLPKGALLNGSTVMDAENYYIQAGNLRDVKCLKLQLQSQINAGKKS